LHFSKRLLLVINVTTTLAYCTNIRNVHLTKIFIKVSIEHIFCSWNQKNNIIIKMKLIGINEGTNYDYILAKNYKSERYCHRVTEKWLTPIFTSHKMNQRHSIPKSRWFRFRVKTIRQSGGWWTTKLSWK